jgi:2-polyprenyl-6-methoxyphenol hydroxylase-like FAD-dependent oxidoreductase
MRRVVITGASVAGLTLAHLLLERGWSVRLRCRPGGPRPTVVINAATSHLLCDVWRGGRDFLSDAHHLRERVVTTHDGRYAIADEAWVPGVALQTHLLATLVQRYPRQGGDASGLVIDTEDTADVDDPDVWHVDASGRRSGARWSGGRRVIVGAHTDVRREAPRDQRWFESVETGWLFGAPITRDGPDAIVQFMAPPLADLTPGAHAYEHDAEALLDRALSMSTLTRERLAYIRPPVRTWAAYPVLDDCWPASRSLRVGEATMALDPICGDGAGYAIRGAWLAAAAVDAVESGSPEPRVRDHCRNRLRLAFTGHLRACLAAYASLTHQACWTGELRAMAGLLAFLRSGPASAGDLPYRLAGSRLIAVREDVRASERRGQLLHDHIHL